MIDNRAALGEMLRLQRLTMKLTLQQLAAKASVSPSHLGRIEKGTRFPSARVLQRIAGPLGYQEDQLFAMAGFLNSKLGNSETNSSDRLDPYVVSMLSQEPAETQQAVIGILTLLKNIARNMNKPDTEIK